MPDLSSIVRWLLIGTRLYVAHSIRGSALGNIVAVRGMYKLLN